jgi:hypothetical protein
VLLQLVLAALFNMDPFDPVGGPVSRCVSKMDLFSAIERPVLMKLVKFLNVELSPWSLIQMITHLSSGKPHCPGFATGVVGSLRWEACLQCFSVVQLVLTVDTVLE